MDSNLLSALIGLIGGIVGVGIGAWLQQRSSHAQMARETTLQLYDRFDDEDILDSRIRADRILAANAASPNPLGLSELCATLSRDDWQHISRTRHFLDQIGLLDRIGYLDRAISGPLFAQLRHVLDRPVFRPARGSRTPLRRANGQAAAAVARLERRIEGDVLPRSPRHEVRQVHRHRPVTSIHRHASRLENRRATHARYDVPMPSDRKPSLILPVAAAALLLLAGYIGAYYWLVERVGGTTVPHYWDLRRQVGPIHDYRRFFAPAHWLDARIRPDVWKWNDADEFYLYCSELELGHDGWRLLVAPREPATK